MKKSKILFVGLEYALENYFSNHYVVLEKYEVVKFSIDKNPLTSWVYRRRSLFSFPVELFLIFIYLLFNRPEYVITAGPKVGLLLSICSRVLCIKNIHWFTGQVWANQRKRGLSFLSDSIVSLLASYICADSHGQAEFLKKNLNNSSRVINVPGFGSINGLDEKYFLRRAPCLSGKSNRLVFIGRITEEKGVFCLLEVARKLSLSGSSLVVEFHGEIDPYFDRKDEFLELVKMSDNVCFNEGFTDPLEVLSGALLLVLPSHREGFGSILIEAQSQGVPVLCSDIYGVSDSLVPDQTGFVCAVDDVDCFYDKVSMLSSDKELRYNMAMNSILFTERFRAANFRQTLVSLYRKIGLVDVCS